MNVNIINVNIEIGIRINCILHEERISKCGTAAVGEGMTMMMMLMMMMINDCLASTGNVKTRGSEGRRTTWRLQGCSR
jgi:hypothetical protein